jgi:oligopeptidase A
MTNRLRCFAGCLQKQTRSSRNVIVNSEQSRCLAHYVLIPEIPSDSAETNPLLRDNTLPPFKIIDTAHVATGLLKLSVALDTDFDQLIEQTKCGQKFDDSTFDRIFLPVEKSLVSLEIAQDTAKHLAYLFPKSKYLTSYLYVKNNVENRKYQRWSNRKFFQILQELESNRHILSESQQKLLDIYNYNCTNRGLKLSSDEADKLNALSLNLNRQYQEFNFKLMHSTNKFSFVLNKSSQVTDIPLQTLKAISTNSQSPTKGPWCVSLKAHVYDDFIKYSNQRELRKSLYEANYSRASYLAETQFMNNAETIKKTLSFRMQQAQLFGYKNYMQFVLRNTSVQNLDNLVGMIETVRTKFKPILVNDSEMLRKYSGLDKLEPWDVDYWKNRHRNELFMADQAVLMQYFPVDKVLNGICQLFRMFGVDLVRKTNLQQECLWHPDVIVYDVIDKAGNMLLNFLLYSVLFVSFSLWGR